MGSVKPGQWHDYDRSFWNAHQVTLNAWSTTTVQLLLGVLLGCVTPQLSNLLYRMWDAIAFHWARFRSESSARSRVSAGGEATNLLAPGANYGSTQQAADDNQHQSTTVPPEVASSTIKQRSAASRVFNYTTLFVGWTLASGLIALVPQNKLGTSNSNNCAVYNLKEDHSAVERRADDLIQAGKEIRAGQYARTCYTTQSVPEPDRCNIFAKPRIPHKCVAARCPFSNRHFCRGTYDAINCSTGWVDASYLGVNSKNKPQFSRTSICTPLDMDAGFVYAHNDTDEGWLFDYYLGSMNGSLDSTEFTYRQRGKPFDWAIPAYLVNSYVSTYYREIDRWKPLSPQLDRANDTFLTVMFIVSARIFYAVPSDDYIFQTTAKYPDSDYFWNADPESHPLACVDHIELRASDGTYYPRIDLQHNKPDREYDFVRAALRQSTIYDAIQARGGNALNAQGKVRGFFSAELAKNQWAVEAENMFVTSLARAQYDAWDIAIGRGQEKALEGSYTNETDQLCGLYKYNLPKAYANTNLVAYVGFLLAAGLIFILGWETSSSTDEAGNERYGNKLVIDKIWGLLKRLATNLQLCMGRNRRRDEHVDAASRHSAATPDPSSQIQHQTLSQNAQFAAGEASSGNMNRYSSAGETPQNHDQALTSQQVSENIGGADTVSSVDHGGSLHDDHDSVDLERQEPVSTAGPLDRNT